MLLSVDGAATSGVVQDVTALGASSVAAEYSTQISVEPSSPSVTQPTSVSVSVLAPSPEASTGQTQAAMLRQLATQGVRGFSIVSRPAMILHDQDGNVWSSVDGPPLVDSTYSNTTSPVDGDPTGPNQTLQDEQAKELTPEGLATLPHVPWSPDFSIKGTLTSDRGWMSFTVPVGPVTSALRLAVRPEHSEDASNMAMVDQIYLIDPNGNLMASLTGIATQTTGTKQTLIVTLQAAPAGGVVVIRMIPSSDAAPAAPTSNGDTQSAPDSSGGGLGALTPPPSTSSTDFTVEVQRNDGSVGSPGDSSASSPFIVPPGSYLPAAPGSDSSHVGSAPATNPANNGTNVEGGYAVNTTIWSNYIGGSERARVSDESVDMESQSESISLGPLLSRGAAPMGPVLATLTDDPAPSINRDERSRRDAEFAHLEGEEGQLVWRLRLSEEADRTTNRRSPRQEEDDLSPLTTLKGLGGLPSLVASFPRRRGPSQAEELAATLEPPVDMAIADEGLLNTTAESRGQQEEIAKAGIATRAVGFIVALGLASGPLYPDLIAFARRRLARKHLAGAFVGRRFFRRRAPRPLV